MIKFGESFYTFKIFSNFPSLVSFISTKAAGNFLSVKRNDLRPLQVFQKVNVDESRVVLARQVHGGSIAWVRDVHAGQIIDKVDALATDQKNLFLLILVADCVPLLFYDPIKKFTACVHSSWRGALQRVSLKVAEEFSKKGSKKENILVGFGPAIGFCHYDVPSSRAKLFDLAFGDDKVTEIREGRFYLNLVEATKKPLISFGIPEKNIEVADICTAENTDQFYSFRGEGDLRGELAAIIGLRDQVV